ncbi:MAG: hypothetical protein ACK5SX_05580 [Sandaracinobacter sp.]
MAMWGPSEFVVTGRLGYYDGEHPLPQVNAPTLLASGEHDEARSSTLKEFARRMPDATYRMVPGSGTGWKMTARSNTISR